MAEFDIKSSVHHPHSHSKNTTIYLDMEDQEEDNNNGKYEANITAHALTRRVITQDSTTVPPLLETQNSFYIDVQGEEPNRVHILNQRDTTLEQIFLITNFAVEIPSAVFDQLSSVHKPQYALISMIMSFTIMLISMVDLARVGRKEQVKWMIRGHIPWFYSPDPHYKALGTFADIVGLVCAIFQCVFATIAYAFLSQHDDNPIKFSVWPLIFAFGVLYSRFPRNPRTIVVREYLDIQPCSPESLSPLNNLSDLWIPEINPPQSFEPPSKQIRDLGCLEVPISNIPIFPCLYMPISPCSSMLRELELWNCPNLMFLPEDMRTLENVSHLALEDCPNFLCLPEYLWTLEKLEFLRIQGCPKLKFSPQQIKKAARIKHLSIDNCLL